MRSLSDDVYKQFADFLEVQCGIVLGANKQYLVKSRLSPLLTRFNVESLHDLITAAMSNKDRDLRAVVIDAMTTNETLWFRDIYPFQLLTERLLPELAASKKPIKIWSAACSSGQEPYSMAMSILEMQNKKPGMLSAGVTILGTDISASMLTQCQRGEYDSLALSRGLSPERKKQFFQAVRTDPNKWEVQDRVKKLVSFRSFNLLESYSSLGKFDVIFCRNVLIYFSPEVKSKILNQFAASLNPGGYLMLGASESLTGLTEHFDMLRCNPGIVYKLKDGSDAARPSSSRSVFDSSKSSETTRAPLRSTSAVATGTPVTTTATSSPQVPPTRPSFTSTTTTSAATSNVPASLGASRSPSTSPSAASSTASRPTTQPSTPLSSSSSTSDKTPTSPFSNKFANKDGK